MALDAMPESHPSFFLGQMVALYVVGIWINAIKGKNFYQRLTFLTWHDHLYSKYEIIYTTAKGFHGLRFTAVS